MQKHTKIYFDHFGYFAGDYIPCEVADCGCVAVDIHHIDARSMGGDCTGAKDVIENLMAMCRKHHDKYGDKKQYKEFLRETHTAVLTAKQ